MMASAGFLDRVSGSTVTAAARPPVVRLSAARLARLQLMLVAALAALHVASQAAATTLGMPFLFGWVPFFNMDADGSLPTAYQTIALLAVAAAIFNVALHLRGAGDMMAWRWAMLGAALVAVAVDDASHFHESVGNTLQAALRLGAAGPGGWYIPPALLPVLPVMAALFLVALPVLRSLPPPTCRALVIAGCIYVGAAAGVETLAYHLVPSLGGFESFRYALLAALEESLEMIAAVIALRAVLSHAGERGYVTTFIPVR